MVGQTEVVGGGNGNAGDGTGEGTGEDIEEDIGGCCGVKRHSCCWGG